MLNTSPIPDVCDSALLGLLPLWFMLIDPTIIIDSKTGVSGADAALRWISC